MTPEILVQLVATVGVIPALFIWLLIRVMNEAGVRETKLMDSLERQGESLEKVANTLDKLEERVERIENDIDRRM